MRRSLVVILLFLVLLMAGFTLQAQPLSTDVAAYQLGLVAETLPGSDLVYSITVTNYGPSTVSSFYILDGWTVDEEGISAFSSPLSAPDFGPFALMGAWQQNREDEDVLAWLLQGDLAPGDTIQFDWAIQVNTAYQGVLINWVSILTDQALEGSWQALTASSQPTPPPIISALDVNPENNRTTDGVTVVTTTPTGEGIDLALYQTGILTEMPITQPLDSVWMIANLGPQPVDQFYVVAGWSLNPNGGTVLAPPISEPDFGTFEVLGRWRQSTPDEELWMWLVKGELLAGDSVEFPWTRALVPTYRGDLVNRAGVAARDVPLGVWTPREGTTTLPLPLPSITADTFPENDFSIESVTTVGE